MHLITRGSQIKPRLKTQIIYPYCFSSRALLGGKVELILVGGAPLSPQTHDFIRVCLGTILIQGKGARPSNFLDSSLGWFKFLRFSSIGGLIVPPKRF